MDILYKELNTGVLELNVSKKKKTKKKTWGSTNKLPYLISNCGFKEEITKGHLGMV